LVARGGTPQDKTPGSTTQGDDSLRHVVVWRDRWNSVMELRTAGHNNTSSGAAYAAGCPDAVPTKIAAAK